MWSRLAPRRRPHYTAVQRLRILELKAARGWPCEEGTRKFLINEQTLQSWLDRLDGEGEHALVQTESRSTGSPTSCYLVQRLRVLLPSMGKVLLVRMLARAGLHLGVTTVGRMLKEQGAVPEGAAEALIAVDIVQGKVVTAKHPGHSAGGSWSPTSHR